MSDRSTQAEAVETLQQLGLKEYEAKCFVALAGMASGTARDVSEQIDVPRTRVYEATRVLESEGLIEIQQSSPQQFRAVSIEEAMQILRRRYESRIDTLEQHLQDLQAAKKDDRKPLEQEVWALSNRDAIVARMDQLTQNAENEILLVVADERVLTDSLIDGLTAASDRGVDVVVGAVNESLERKIADYLPEARVFSTGLDWLNGGSETTDPVVGRLLLVDGNTILASSITPHGDTMEERAVYGTGFGNSLVVITRRLLSTGLDFPPK